MARSQPYQSLVFRCLHAAQGVLALLAMATGYWLLNTWDDRFFSLPLPSAGENIFDLHGGIGEIFIKAIALFIAYSLWAGRRRLVQLRTFHKLTQLGKPAGWYSLHQCVNTGLLIMAVLAVISGDKLSDDALMAGDYSSVFYNLHVFAWAGMATLTLCHLLLGIKVGGVPLLVSAFSLTVRPKDSPRHWPKYWKDVATKWRAWVNTRFK